MSKFLLFVLIFCSINRLFAQYEDFGFQRDLSIIVKDSLNNNLTNAWGGGLNSCQFSSIDLNFDGIKDLFVFDRSSDKVITYINNGTANTIDYTSAPEYRNYFPSMHDWAVLKDYNNDGKEDIFTYGVGGITVYKNISNPADGIKFSLVTNMILSQQGPNLTNLLVTAVDYPALSDIDNDGDLDVLAFFGLGSYVEYHKNLSVETYGVPDSLKFQLEEYCWGKFAENASSNNILLNTTCPYKQWIPGMDENISDSKEIEHTGSTLLAADMNGDGIKELLIGDVGYPGIIKLINGGTLTDALMTSEDTLFPSNSVRVNLISFPVPSILDVDNDGNDDLIVSPFEPSPIVSENLKSNWFYKNIGTTSIPDFDYRYNNFLQKDMIETGAGAYPVLCDYNGDGLLDLFIGNFGIHDSSYYSYGNLISVFRSRIALYKNIGTISSPVFQFITNDFGNIGDRKLNGIVPAFGDIDGDNAKEMIIGKSDGTVDLYENTNSAGQPMNMVLSQQNYQSINVGKFSAPQLIDLDGDNLLDLVIGEKNGNLNYYRNTGSPSSPAFTLISDSLGGVDVVKHAISNYGYSVPCFFKDSLNHFKLFAGSESGYIYYYKDIEANLTGHFTLADSMLLRIYEGGRSAVTVFNIDNDSFPEMIIGNYSGGVAYFKGITPPPVSIAEFAQQLSIQMKTYPIPADDKLFITGDNIESFDKCTVGIYNIIGKSVLCRVTPASQGFIIDTQNLRDGLYCYSIAGSLKTSERIFFASGKFVVQH